MKNKIFYRILIIGAGFVIVLVVFYFIENLWQGTILSRIISPGTSEYYGSFTGGPCQNTNDCFISGCNSEICQSRAEETIASICIYPDKPTPLELGYICGCVNQGCKWVR